MNRNRKQPHEITATAGESYGTDLEEKYILEGLNAAS